MATQGAAPQQAQQEHDKPGRGDPAVLAWRLSGAGAEDPHAGQKRSPARGIAIGLVVAALLWGVALYAAFSALH